MKLQVLSPELGSTFESDDRVQFRLKLAGWLGPIEGIRLLLVVNDAGETIGSDGSSRTLSSAEDLELLLAARSLAGVAITSAKTAVAEQLNQSSLCPILVVFGDTDPGDFPGRTQPDTSRHPLHLLKSTKGRIAIPTILNAATTLARSSGRTGLLLESGLTLAKVFADEGLITELVLSVKSPDASEIESAKWMSVQLGVPFENLKLRTSARLADEYLVFVWTISR